MAKAMPLAIGFIMINVLLGIMVTAFANDPLNTESVGKAGAINSEITTSTDDDLSITTADGWLSKFTTQLFGLPWWLQTMFYTFEVAGLLLIVYALIRGI